MSSLPSFAAIAAFDEDRGLGKDGDLPWHLPTDLKHFARTTTQTKDSALQNGVIMGRVTCETIPAKYWPLSRRRNVVVTRNPEWSIEGADTHQSLEDAIRSLDGKVEKVFVVGGGQIYKLALEFEECTELFITRIDGHYGCDAFFPEYESTFELAETLGQGDEDGAHFVIERWIRKE